MKKNNLILNIGMFGVLVSLGYILFVLIFGTKFGSESEGVRHTINMLLAFGITLVSAILIAIGIFIEKKK